jgi:DNA-binding CsgD family transcriptional regulator
MKSENESFDYSGVYHGESGNETGSADLIKSEKSPGTNLSESGERQPYSACLIDRSGRQFVCFHEHCINQKSCIRSEMQDEKFDFQALDFHPDDKTCLYERIFPDILKFMATIPVEELAFYRFSFNHRYIRKDGSITQFLQEGTLAIFDDGSLPVLNLKVFTEIGDFKTDESIILSIFRYSSDLGYQKVYTKVYGNNDNLQLSHREMEIIKLCLEGLSSKMIADKLNLSIHTVKNHKRNCMEKTLTHNITELINLCIRSHWI